MIKGNNRMAMAAFDVDKELSPVPTDDASRVKIQLIISR
jgi:hypothetical protein